MPETNLKGCEFDISISPYGHCFIRTGGKSKSYSVKTEKDIGKAVIEFLKELNHEA